MGEYLAHGKNEVLVFLFLKLEPQAHLKVKLDSIHDVIKGRTAFYLVLAI